MTTKKILLENISSLYLLQGINFLLPLVTFPYLVRVLGPEKFGLIAFSMSFIQYFVVITDYGFNITGTRMVSIWRADHERLSEIFFSIVFVKLLLMVVCFLILTAILNLFEMFKTERLLYYICFFAVFGNVLFPVWFFQGIEKIKFIANVNLIVKAISTGALFIFVNSQSDYLAAALIQVLGVVAAGVFSIGAVFWLHRLKYKQPTRQMVKIVLTDGWIVFLSQVSVNLFSNSGIFVLGLFANAATLGNYAIADKIIKAVISLVAPLCNSIFPRVSTLFAESKERAIVFLRRTLKLGLMAFVSTSLLLICFADSVVKLVAGSANNEIALLVRMLALLPVTVFVDNIYGTQILLNIKEDKEFLKAIVITGIFSLVGSLVFVPHFGARASAGMFTLSGLLIMILMIMPVKRYGIKLMNPSV